MSTTPRKTTDTPHVDHGPFAGMRALADGELDAVSGAVLFQACCTGVHIKELSIQGGDVPKKP